MTGVGNGSGSKTRRGNDSWLNGPRPAGSPATAATPAYPGERLGLPASGRMSVGGLGRRVVALCIDWACCLLIVSLVTGERLFTPQHSATLTLAVFGAENLVLLPIVGSTFGMRVMGIGVRRLDGSRVPFPWLVVRTVLLLVVIPAVIYDVDQRGYHDKAANCVVVRI